MPMQPKDLKHLDLIAAILTAGVFPALKAQKPDYSIERFVEFRDALQTADVLSA